MKRFALPILALTCAAAFAGCNSSGLTGSTTGDNPSFNEVAALAQMDASGDPVLAGMVGLDNDAVFDAPVFGDASSQSILPDALRFGWYRKLTHTQKNINRSGSPDSVYVVMDRDNDGEFIGKVRRHGKDSKDSTLYSKDFSSHWSRAAIFKKVASDSGEDHSRWMPVALGIATCTQTAPNVPTPTITRVVISGQDILGTQVSATYDDPSRLYDPAAVPAFAPGTEVAVQVFTDGGFDSRRVFLHADLDANDRGRCERRPMNYNSTSGAFESHFVVRTGFGKDHKGGKKPRGAVWVDVLNKATLYDTDAAYSSTGWGIPYRLLDLRRPPQHS